MQDRELNELPDISETYALSGEQVETFRRDGHILLRGVADPSDVEAYRPLIVDTVRELSGASKPLEERDTYGKAFIQIPNLWTRGEALRRFVFARRFAKIAAELMGVKGVRIYHDQALFKEPGGGHTPWHQDQIYWPLDTNDMITLWMPLVPLVEASGTMTFASGSHRHGYVSKLAISDQSHKTLKDYIASRDMPIVNHGGMAAGDATFHYGWTIHSAGANATDAMREVMTIIYYADGARLIEPDSNARKTDMKELYPGLKPGDVAANEWTPLIYERGNRA
ncbi:MAG TPA: phytanoyl-CoA dioxygenase family protein [Paenibacillus sp.]|nr:phytanoyl-CoA dioxygenase family protein [Paenibacillus sp.]